MTDSEDHNTIKGEQSPYRISRPLLVATAITLAAALGVVNFAAVLYGDKLPWLVALDLFADLGMLAAAITAAAVLAMTAEAHNSAQARLDNAQARLAAVLESAMDAIIAIDESQHIVLFNRAAEEIFHCRRDEVIGTSLERFLPARFRSAHRDHVSEFGRSGITRRRMGDTTILWAMRSNGDEFPVEASISQTRIAGKRYFTAILRDVTRRKEIEDALHRQQRESRELSARVLEAREEEKTLIARELHDELGQLLTALKMDLSWMRERMPADLAPKAAEMSALLDQTVGSVRRISADLRPLMLDDLGLADAAQWLAEDFGRRSGIACRIDLGETETFASLDRGPATAIYRALQESLTNVARHSGAKHAWIVLGQKNGHIELEVEDDGRGITADDIAKARSLGLKGMRERIHYHGGLLEIGRAPRGGTRVHARLPLHPPQENRSS